MYNTIIKVRPCTIEIIDYNGSRTTYTFETHQELIQLTEIYMNDLMLKKSFHNLNRVKNSFGVTKYDKMLTKYYEFLDKHLVEALKKVPCTKKLEITLKAYKPILESRRGW